MKLIKHSIVLLCFLFSSQSLFSQQALPIIPYPNSVSEITGDVTFSSLNVEAKHSDLADLKSFTISEFANRFNINSSKKGYSVVLKLSDKISNIEGYTIDIKKKKTTVTAASTHGLFNGVQSLIQLLYFYNEDNVLPICYIKDEPRFAWRGFMLDESRHFYGKTKVLQILDLMALHKINKFHWHLTDAPGWRLEIKKYPKLTTIGSIGCHSDPNTEPLFYSQEDISEIIKYAQERFIEVIPEIDMPGHASAAVLAYPEVSGGGGDNTPNFTFNPGKEETYVFLTNILREVSQLFPSKYIHLGGDEVHFGNKHWNTDPGVQKLMKDNSYTTLTEVEHYFMRRMNDTLLALNKTLVGWDEISASGIDKNSSLLMWWRHDKEELLKEVLSNDYNTVLCPRIPMYFDFLQEDAHKVGRKWNGIVNIEKVFNFPDDLDVDISGGNVIGIQANMWTERTRSNESLDFLVWPRLSAMSEAAWTTKENKNYSDFKVQLKNLYKLYDIYNLYYYNMFDVDFHPEPKGAGAARWQELHK